MKLNKINLILLVWLTMSTSQAFQDEAGQSSLSGQKVLMNIRDRLNPDNITVYGDCSETYTNTELFVNLGYPQNRDGVKIVEEINEIFVIQVQNCIKDYVEVYFGGYFNGISRDTFLATSKLLFTKDVLILLGKANGDLAKSNFLQQPENKKIVRQLILKAHRQIYSPLSLKSDELNEIIGYFTNDQILKQLTLKEFLRQLLNALVINDNFLQYGVNQ